jgi:YfiH family protein
MSEKLQYIGPNWDSSAHIITGFSLLNAHDESNVGLDLGINTQTPLERTSANRSLFLKTLGLDDEAFAFARQVHGVDVAIVERPGLLESYDGLVTNKTDLALGILVADCAAVLISDSENGVIGAFHAGWRGALGGILAKGIQKMRDLGAKSMDVWVSPCIGTEAFEVGDEVAAQFPAEFVKRDGFPKPHIDLKAYVLHQLLEVGIQNDRISIDNRCTFSNEAFYSYRRQKDKSGRMMAVICRKSISS